VARNELGGEKGRQQLSLRSKSGKAQIARTLGAIHHLRHTPARTQAPQHRMGSVCLCCTRLVSIVNKTWPLETEPRGDSEGLQNWLRRGASFAVQNC